MIKNLQVFSIALVLLAVSTVAHAATVTARLDRNQVVVGETVTLTLQADDTDQSLDTDLAALERDFNVLEQRSETQMSLVNGRKTAYVRLKITLEPKRAGTLRIPALKFPGASSQPLALKVSAPLAPEPGAPEPVFLEVNVQPETGPYYVLSQVGLTVRIFYQANLTEAAINPPAPLQAAVRLLDEVPYQAERNGVQYRVLERRYAIFPERSGVLTIPPMQLSGRLIERPSNRLWQPTVRGRRVQVESEPLNLDISPRPAEFSGDHWLPARSITLSEKISDGETLHVGEPVTRTVILDAVGLEENMLEEPVWPDIPDVRIYPDQPQGISRDDGKWVLGHKEFRYAIVPERAGELVLPEIRLDWWDTVTNQQRTAVLPEYRVNVVPSALSKAVPVLPPVADTTAGLVNRGSSGQSGATGTMLWKTTTAAFAILWLLTLYFYVRRAPAKTAQAGASGSDSSHERTLLKHFQQACRRNDASAARKDLAKWVRNYAPSPMRGSMRDFGVACGDQALQQYIAGLDASGFAGDGAEDWQGDALWAAFKAWQNRVSSVKTLAEGDRPDLYRSTD